MISVNAICSPAITPYNLSRSTASEQLSSRVIESGCDAVVTLFQARVALHTALIVHIPQLEGLARGRHYE